jgi:hypothetical protein
MQRNSPRWTPPDQETLSFEGEGKALTTWDKFREGWYRLAAVPKPPTTATYIERERAQKMRSLSLAVLIIWVIFLLFIPGCFVIANARVIYADFGMMPICLIALIINKNRHPVVAAALVTICFEVALAAVCLTTWPFDEPSLQQYELFTLGDIMALTLLSPRGLRLVGLANALFIALDLVLQPHTAILNHDLQTQFFAILIRPVSIQLMVAFFVSSYAENQIETTKRADRAQMVAAMEHHKVAEVINEKQDLERITNGVEQIVQQYVYILNQSSQHGSIPQREAKINDTGLPSVLKPISSGYNLLLARLRSANEQARESDRLQQAIRYYTGQIQAGQFSPGQLRVTGTSLDPLFAVWSDYYSRRQAWAGQENQGSQGSQATVNSFQPREEDKSQDTQGHRMPLQSFDSHEREGAPYGRSTPRGE